jgi:hypothetical protein
MRLADVEPGLAPKETAVTPLYQVNQAVFGIRRQVEYAAGSWEYYNEALAKSKRTGNDWITQSQATEEQLQALNVVGQEFGQILMASFQAAIINGESFFDSVRNGLKAYIQQMLAATAATLTLAAAMAIIFPNVGFKAAFNVLGGGMGLPFGMGDNNQLSLRLSGTDFYGGVVRNTNRVARSGG